MGKSNEKLHEIIYSTTEWWKAKVWGKNVSEAKFRFMNDMYDRSTEEHEYDAKKNHVDTVHIESCYPVKESEDEKSED